MDTSESRELKSRRSSGKDIILVIWIVYGGTFLTFDGNNPLFSSYLLFHTEFG